MVDFVSEVQEELRKDDYNRWLKKYGPYVLALIVAAVLGTAYVEWKKIQDENAARATSIAYISATEKADGGNIDGAIADYMALSQESPNGYSGLSLMRAAELELGRGDTSRAISLLDQAAATFDMARHAQLAQIKAAYILAGEGRYDDVRVRVTTLAEKDQPYEYLARELLGFSARAAGDVEAAKEQFSYLERIPGVPETIQQRATQNLALMRASGELEALEDISPELAIETPDPADIIEDDIDAEIKAPEPVTVETEDTSETNDVETPDAE